MIYQLDHPGVALATDDEKRVALNETLYQGFFLASDLRDLLHGNDCVGIRIYNVDGERIEDRRLIAIGISGDGSELNQPDTDAKYLVSRAPSLSGVSAEKMPRKEAKETVEAPAIAGIARNDIFFASFFSKDMIESLLKSPEKSIAVDGIRFYVTPQKSGLPGMITHCGVSAALDTAGSKVAQLAALVLSDRPCPGFCVNSDPLPAPDNSTGGLESMNRVTLPAGVAFLPGSDMGKYLFIW